MITMRLVPRNKRSTLVRLSSYFGFLTFRAKDKGTGISVHLGSSSPDLASIEYLGNAPLHIQNFWVILWSFITAMVTFYHSIRKAEYRLFLVVFLLIILLPLRLQDCWTTLVLIKEVLGQIETRTFLLSEICPVKVITFEDTLSTVWLINSESSHENIAALLEVNKSTCMDASLGHNFLLTTVDSDRYDKDSILLTRLYGHKDDISIIPMVFPPPVITCRNCSSWNKVPMFIRHGRSPLGWNVFWQIFQPAMAALACAFNYGTPLIGRGSLAAEDWSSTANHAHSRVWYCALGKCSPTPPPAW